MILVVFFGSIIAIALAAAISRACVDIRKIREHFDRVDRALVAQVPVVAPGSRSGWVPASPKGWTDSQAPAVPAFVQPPERTPAPVKKASC